MHDGFVTDDARAGGRYISGNLGNPVASPKKGSEHLSKRKPENK